jgi:Flp pilus assembly protein TadG
MDVHPMRLASSILPRLHRCDRGTATVEFALVTPIALFLSLILLQVMLLMTGHIFVNYAAFAAVRSAITTIPYVTESEPGNLYVSGSTLGKHEAIRRAAVFAVMPVSGRLDSTGAISAEAFVSGLQSYFEASSQTTPRWVQSLAGDRLRYADANTRVEVCTTEALEDGSVTITPISQGVEHLFAPQDPITVRVTHRFSLSVPYVRRIFADDKHSGGSGYGLYTLMSAQYTLTNEGIAKTLPPTPALDRDP